VKIQGRQLRPEELKKEDEREQRFRQKITSLDFKHMASKKETWLTPALMDKFQFKVHEKLACQGRKTLALVFQPKADKLPAKTIQDKVINCLTGTVWVDEEDSEMVQCSVHLSEPVYVGLFGIIGVPPHPASPPYPGDGLLTGKILSFHQFGRILDIIGLAPDIGFLQVR